MIDDSSLLLAQIAILAFLAWSAFIFLILFLDSLLGKTKSGKHRSLMVDLYVVGMIRQFAEQDKVNLEEEMKEMRRFDRLMKLRNKDLDAVIEEQLKEKVNKKTEEIIGTKTK